MGGLALSLVLFSAVPGWCAGSPWKYVIPEPGDRYEHGPLRALPSSEERPADLQQTIDNRGGKCRYAQVRFGGANSPHVALVVEELPSAEVNLYVDADRNRKIEPSERVAGAERRWRFELESEWRDDNTPTPDYVSRTVIVQLSRSGRTLSFATAGFMEGSVQLASGAVSARRLDGDGNGAFADPDDRIWVDLDNNGQWDRFGEQFPCRPIMKLGDARYAVRNDRRGDSLTLEELSGTGTVKVQVALRDESVKIREFQALLIGRDGSAVGLADAAEPTTVPTNEYRLESMNFVLNDPEGKTPWCYSFSPGEHAGEGPWYTVQAGDTITIEPVREVQFTADMGRNTTEFHPGESIDVTPRLRTAQGLEIDMVWRGDRQNYSREYVTAELRVLKPDGELLGSARSGFS
jgi:hypothetical protein